MLRVMPSAYLADSGADIGEGYGAKEGGVDEGVDRRKEVTDAILAVVIDGYLDTNGRINHPKERRRQATPRDATAPARARETGSVGEYAASNGEHRFGATERVCPSELVEHEGKSV